MPPFPDISRIGLTFDLNLSSTELNIDRGHLLVKDYLPTKFEASGAKRSWYICCTRCGRPTWPSNLTLTFDLNINRDHLLVIDYLPAKFVASRAKHSWVIGCTNWGIPTWPMSYWPENQSKDHIFIMEYLPTKFEATGAKCSWVISCTRCRRPTWPLNLTLHLLTWISIGIIYSSRTIYIPKLKLLGQSVLELSVAQGVGDQHDLFPWPITYWPDYQ